MANDLNRSIKIYIDHSEAMKKATDFGQKIDAVKQKLIDLSNQGKKDTPEYKTQEENLRKLEVSYDRYKTKLAETERILKNLSGATRGELEALQKELRKSLKDVAQGTDEYKAKVQALVAVEKQLSIVKKEQNGTLGRNATLWSRVADGFNKYFGIVTSVIAGITGLSFAFRKLSEDVAKMDDVYADVMKTTNLTRDEVLNLNEEFKKMDTRTAREELNNLARDAGKLGINGTKDILDFVEAGNQINVALGEDLGEGAIKNIGKMTDVYARSTKELESMDMKGKMLAIGSAINELGMSSTASEAYMVNFTQRLGGVASQAGISIQNILGYASALDQSGQAVEMSATALQKFIMKLMGEPAKFAKLAGLEVKTFTDLLQNDTNAAIKQVLSALSEKGGFQALIPVFKDMGLDGARAVGVLSALATNIEKVNTAQEISNRAFTEGTSITDEYTIKNNNLNAQLEKARKEFKDSALELGERLNPVLLTSTKWTTNLIKILPSIFEFFDKHGKKILYLSIVGGAYVAGMKLQVLWNTKLAAALTLSNIQLKLKNGWLIITRVSALAYNAVIALVTGNTIRAAAAWKLLNATMKASWFGIALAAITALGIAIYNYTQRTKEAITQAKRLEEVHNDGNRAISAERSELNLLLSVARNEKISKEERLKAIKRLNEISPEYLGNLNLENINTQAATDSVKKYTEELLKNAKAKAILDKVTEAQGQLLQKDIELEKLKKSRDKREERLRNGDFSTAQSAAGSADIIKIQDKRIEELKKEKEAIQETMDTYTDFHNKLLEKPERKNSFPDTLLAATDQLEKLEQAHADAYNRIEEKKKNLWYSDAEKLVDNMQLKSLGDQIEAQKELIRQKEISINIKSEDTDNDITPIIPTGDEKEVKKLAAKQKKELDLILENLETVHQQKLTDIKKKYQSGEIKSKSDFDAQIFGQNQAYYILQEQALSNFLKKVSDKALRSDITKQIADIQNKQQEEALKRQEKIEQIILDADPERKEKIAYENRLRDAGLFGVERETLTADQLKALELLEQQHQDNLDKIRRDRENKDKKAAEEQFEKDFKDRKTQLQQEIADDEQKLSVATGIGALSGESAFNAEVELQRKRIALIQEEIAAREKAGLDTTRIMQKYRTEEQNLTKLYINEYNRRSKLYNQYGENIGSALGNVLIGQENALRDFGSTMLDILFDILGSIINAKIAEATAVAIAEQAKAAAISAAQPDSVISFGATAVARTAAIGAIIMGALAAAKAALKGLISKGKSSSGSSGDTSSTSYSRVVSQQRDGKYDVIGADDGRLYKNVPYAGPAKTGMVYTPTLVGESGGELVVSSPDLKALQKHINYPLIVQAINDVRAGAVSQRALGKYDSVDNLPSGSNGSKELSELKDVIKDLSITVSKLRKTKLRAEVSYYDQRDTSDYLEDIENFGKKN